MKKNLLISVLLVVLGLSFAMAAYTTPTISPADGTIDTDGSVNFTATVEANSTACTLYFPENNPGRASYSMSIGGANNQSCSILLTNIPEQTYKWYVSATNGTDTANSTTNAITIDISTSAGKVAILNQLEKEGKLARTGQKTFTVVSDVGEFINSKILGLPVWIVLLVAIVVIVVLIKRK